MNKVVGRLGEDIATKYYLDLGYSVLERNYKVREGEIDIVAKKGDDLVFVEVKLRKTLLFGGAINSLPLKRIIRLKNATLVYLQKNPELTTCQPRLALLTVQDNEVSEISLD